jgi:hypothetical protein
MRAVRVRQTHIPDLYWGEDSRLYKLVTGTETKCCRCGRWAQTIFRWGQEKVCGRHVRVVCRTRVRLTTTFALRVYRDGAGELPVGLVMRRGDEFAVLGPPRRQERFDRFDLPGGGFVLVPRGRWAWV